MVLQLRRAVPTRRKKTPGGGAIRDDGGSATLHARLSDPPAQQQSAGCTERSGRVTARQVEPGQRRHLMPAQLPPFGQPAIGLRQISYQPPCHRLRHAIAIGCRSLRKGPAYQACSPFNTFVAVSTLMASLQRLGAHTSGCWPRSHSPRRRSRRWSSGAVPDRLRAG